MDLGRPWVLRGLVIALAVVVGLVAWMATRDGDDEPAGTPETAGVRIVSEEELADAAATAEHPVYWAGQIADTELELTEDAAGGILVRYVDPDDEEGDAIADRLAVGSYPLPNPRRALNAFAEVPGAIVRSAPDVGRVVTNRQAETSVYFVDPDNEVQVEVYAPSPKRAMSLVRSGQVQPVG